MLLDSLTDPHWQRFFEQELSTSNATSLFQRLDSRKKNEAIIYPDDASILNAFALTPLKQVRVVILGQDPYHGEGQAMGLAFSVPDRQKIPPSLRNIFKEVEADIGLCHRTNGDLTDWARQGVLLLNSILTVEKGKAGAHAKFGWDRVTNNVIRHISENTENVVFLLWGAFAFSKRDLINEDRHLILHAAHPSPLSAHRGFIGSRHFSKTNSYLKAHGKSAIQW